MTSHDVDDKNAPQTVEDLAMGCVESDDLLDNIEDAIENRKTTLCWTHQGRVLKTYFTYKGVMDLSDLAKPLGQQRREGIVSISVRCQIVFNFHVLTSLCLNHICRRRRNVASCACKNSPGS